MTVWTEKDKKYEDECGLSHLKTNQQPLGNKNVLSVIVNYKYWSSPCCSLLIMLNGLPLTIMKPLTLCMCVRLCACVCMCVWARETERETLWLLIWGNMLSVFYGLEGSSASQHQPCGLSNIKFTCLLCVCSSVSDVSGQNKDSKDRGKRLNEGKVKMRFYKECWQKPV